MIKLRWMPTVLALAFVFGACGGKESDPGGTSPVADPTSTAGAPSTREAVVGEGSLATDGICQITIPDDWIDDGTGRGVTALGDKWTLFGGSIADDAEWNSAKDLLKTQMNPGEESQLTEDAAQIVIALANGRGYVVRQRFDDRYCEFSVTALTDRGVEITDLWRSIATTLSPVAAD